MNNRTFTSLEEMAKEKKHFPYTPLLIVISAPSGAGKTTLCDKLLKDNDNIVYSISCTTRQPRGKEKNGVDYYFLTEEQFREYIDAGLFLEYALVHGNYYGTLMKTVRDALENGKHVLLDIDVQGVDQIREKISVLPDDDPLKQGFLDIFIAPPSLQILRERLVGRAEDAPEVIEQRMENAEQEMARADDYEYHIINDDLDTAYRQLNNIIRKESEII